MKEQHQSSQLVLKNQAVWLTISRDFPHLCHMQKNKYNTHYVQEEWLDACFDDSWYSLQSKNIKCKKYYSYDFSILWIQCNWSTPTTHTELPNFPMQFKCLLLQLLLWRLGNGLQLLLTKQKNNGFYSCLWEISIIWRIDNTLVILQGHVTQ